MINHWNHKWNKYLIIVFLLVASATLGVKSNARFGWSNELLKEGEPVSSDGAGYYSYLPQWFIYGTDHFEFLDTIVSTYPKSHFGENTYSSPGGVGRYNKYYTGTAVAILPFFTIGHAFAGNLGEPQDGYSRPYLMSINIAAIFYCLLGCIGCFLFFRRFHIHPAWCLLTAAMIVFGTNLSYYTVVQPAYSHVYTFGLMSWLLLVVKHCVDTFSRRYWLLFCFLLGFVIIIRPTNLLIVLFIPFLFESWSVFWQRLKRFSLRQWKLVLAGGVVFLIPISFQLWSNVQQTGDLFAVSYPGETFTGWFNPEFFNVLFSWRKGLFVFAPVLLLTILSWIFLVRKQRRLIGGALLFFLVLTYVLASWWCWWYGGGLGMRPYIDFFPVLFLPIALLLQSVANVWKITIAVFSIGACWLYGVYEYQMRRDILHYDNMTYEQFSRVFLRTEGRYSWALHLNYEQLPDVKPSKTQWMRMRPRGQAVDERERMLSPAEWGDNAQVMVYPDASRNCRFGMRVTGKLFLFTEESNPFIQLIYFKEGKTVYSHDYFVGPFIPKILQWEPLKLELYPELKTGDVDSVKVLLEECMPFLGAADMKLQLNYY